MAVDHRHEKNAAVLTFAIVTTSFACCGWGLNISLAEHVQSEPIAREFRYQIVAGSLLVSLLNWNDCEALRFAKAGAHS